MLAYTTLTGLGLLKPGNALHVPSITSASFKDTVDADATFVVRISMEKADGGEILTGESSLSTGALVNVNLKNATCQTATIHLEFTQLLEVSSSGCQILE